MVKPEKFDYLHLVCHFIIPLSLTNYPKLNKLVMQASPLCWWHWSVKSDKLYPKRNKLVNTDLKHLVNWLNAHEISLNVSKKPEIVKFKSKQQKFEGDLKIKLW